MGAFETRPYKVPIPYTGPRRLSASGRHPTGAVSGRGPTARRPRPCSRRIALRPPAALSRSGGSSFTPRGPAGDGGLLRKLTFRPRLHVEPRIYGPNQQVGDEAHDQDTDHDKQGEGVEVRPGASCGRLVVGDGVDD